MKKKKSLRYEGLAYDVEWDGSLCMHMGECVRDETELFVKGRKPWAEPDLVTPEKVLEVVGRCPSGALTCRSRGEAPEEEPDEANTVAVSANGPLYFRGELRIERSAPEVSGSATRAALCRCGASSNKPFCDGSHVKMGFRDSGAVGKTGPGVESAGGALEILPRKDGPLIVGGNLTIVSSGGRPTWTGTKVALCRCGASSNKPFCDGTHKRIDFRSD